MSRINGEKARANLEKRSRAAMRLKTRTLKLAKTTNPEVKATPKA